MSITCCEKFRHGNNGEKNRTLSCAVYWCVHITKKKFGKKICNNSTRSSFFLVVAIVVIMKAAAAYNFEEIAEEIIDEMTCPVCLELFEEPFMLPCSHNFCASCLKQLLLANSIRNESDNKHLVCPSCRSITQIEDAKPNLLVKNMVSKITFMQKKQDVLVSTSSTNSNNYITAPQVFTIVEYVPNENHIPVSRHTIERWMRLSDTFIIHNKSETRDEFVIKTNNPKSAQIARSLIQYDLSVNKNVQIEYLGFPLELFEHIRKFLNSAKFHNTLFYTRLLEIEQHSGVSRIELVYNDATKEEETGPYFRIEGICKYSILMARALLNSLIKKISEFAVEVSESAICGTNSSDNVAEQEQRFQGNSISYNLPDISSLNRDTLRAMKLPMSADDPSDSSCIIM